MQKLNKELVYFECSFELMEKAEDKYFSYILASKALGSFDSQDSFVLELAHGYIETERSYFYMLEVRPKYSHLRNQYINLLKKLDCSRASNKNRFTCVVDKASQTVKFGPHFNLGMLSEKLKGMGIGSYCFGRLVARLVEDGFGHYGVDNICLSSSDANTSEAHLRRNYFYARRGFRFGNTSDEHEKNVETMKAGSCFAFNVQGLKQSYNPSKIAEITLGSYDLLSHFYRGTTKFT